MVKHDAHNTIFSPVMHARYIHSYVREARFRTGAAGPDFKIWARTYLRLKMAKTILRGGGQN